MGRSERWDENRDGLRWFFNEWCQQPSGNCLHDFRSEDLSWVLRELSSSHASKHFNASSRKRNSANIKMLHNVLINIVYVLCFLLWLENRWMKPFSSVWLSCWKMFTQKSMKLIPLKDKQTFHFFRAAPQKYKHMISLFNSNLAAITIWAFRCSGDDIFRCRATSVEEKCGDITAAVEFPLMKRLSFMTKRSKSKASPTLSHQNSNDGKLVFFSSGRTSSFSWKSFDYWISLKTFQ